MSSAILLIVLLVFSFFFSGAEASMTAAGRSKLLALSDLHPHKKKTFLWLLDHPQRVLASVLVGNNLVSIAASAVATALALRFFQERGPLIAVVLMTVVVVIFCEILPKTIAIAKTDAMLLMMGTPLKLFCRAMTPLTYVTFCAVKIIGKAFGTSLENQGSFISREEIDHLVKESGASGALEEEESKMISGIIAFEETRVSEIMVPRTDMTALPATASVKEAAEVFKKGGHSRLPVYDGDIDHVVGILYVKDLLECLISGDMDMQVSKLQREPTFVPKTMKTAELFDIMKRARMHIAIVVDEYGGTAGLLTMEDLLEEIVGEIQDEYDEETTAVREEPDGSFTVQGQTHLEDLSEALDYTFECEDVDTLAGLVISVFGGFPDTGDKINYRQWEITVTKAEEHRVLEVNMRYQEEMK